MSWCSIIRVRHAPRFPSLLLSLPSLFFSLSTQCGLGSGNDVGEGGRRSKKKENKRKKGKEEAPEKAGPGALGWLMDRIDLTNQSSSFTAECVGPFPPLCCMSYFIYITEICRNVPVECLGSNFWDGRLLFDWGLFVLISKLTVDT